MLRDVSRTALYAGSFRQAKMLRRAAAGRGVRAEISLTRDRRLCRFWTGFMPHGQLHRRFGRAGYRYAGGP